MQEVNELSLFIQKNEKFYNKKFKKMNETGKSVSWNWAAFFMGIYWMVYRKMYFKAAAFFLLSMVASSTPYIGAILNLAVLVGVGVYANALYLDHVNESIKITKISPEDKEEIISKRGGTNLPLALMLYTVVIVSTVFGILGS